MEPWGLDIETKVVLLASGAIFLWALLLGVWKYRQMMTSEDHRAHFYVDTAHRAALLYAFATLLVAVFVQFGAWSIVINLVASGALILFFVAAIGTYVYHGWRRDTDNQLRDPAPGTGVFMILLIAAEVGGFAVLLAGFVRAQFL